MDWKDGASQSEKAEELTLIRKEKVILDKVEKFTLPVISPSYTKFVSWKQAKISKKGRETKIDLTAYYVIFMSYHFLLCYLFFFA